MKKKILNLNVWLVAFTCLFIATSCKNKPAEVNRQTYATKKVEGKTDKTITTSYSASIEGMQDIDIYPKVSGYIVKLNVSEGQTVRKGQVLFVIDQVPYQTALATAVANVKDAEANLAKAKLAQARAEERDARNNLSYTEVKSPSDGVVGMLPYRVGTLVSPSMTKPLTTVSDNSKMYVYFSMPENQLLTMVRQYGTKDNAIKQMPEIQLQLNDGSIFDEKGKIESISGVIDKETGAVGLRAVFPNKSKLLYSGSSGNVLIPSEFKNCIVIPQEATVQQQDKYIVYKVVNGKAVSTLITVAPYNDGKEYIVTGGLSVGDEYVSKGAGLVREGTIVK